MHTHARRYRWHSVVNWKILICDHENRPKLDCWVSTHVAHTVQGFIEFGDLQSELSGYKDLDSWFSPLLAI